MLARKGERGTSFSDSHQPVGSTLGSHLWANRSLGASFLDAVKYGSENQLADPFIGACGGGTRTCFNDGRRGRPATAHGLVLIAQKFAQMLARAPAFGVCVVSGVLVVEPSSACGESESPGYLSTGWFWFFHAGHRQ